LDSSNQEYSLVSNSRILFEFKSKNNVVLKSDLVDLDQKNGVVSCYVEVLKDPFRTFEEVEDGEGTLTMVGSLGINQNTASPIPEKFKGAMNYRCIFPIEIRKNLINADSPVTTNVTHKIQTIKGQFCFAKANISPLKTSKLGLTYNPSTGVPAQSVVGSVEEDSGGSTF